jgi:DNA polymerase elongation subunit (family B)
MNAPRILAWDIETSPHAGYVWGLWNQNIGLSQIIKPGGMISFSARWVDEPKSSTMFEHVSGTTEAQLVESRGKMLGTLYSLLDEADGLVSWNGKNFDTRKANAEFIKLGWGPYSEAKEIDLMRAVKKVASFPSFKLEHIAQVLLGKGKVQHEGFALWIKCMADDPKAWARMGRYNRQDVDLLIELYYYLLPWIDTIPNRNLFDGYDGCPKCGSDNVQRRGSRVTKVAKYARYQCQDCGSWASIGKAEERVDIR